MHHDFYLLVLWKHFCFCKSFAPENECYTSSSERKDSYELKPMGKVYSAKHTWDSAGQCFCTSQNVFRTYTVKICPFQYTFRTTSPLTMLRKLCQRMFNIFKRNKFQMKYIPLNLVTTLDWNNLCENVEQGIWLVAASRISWFAFNFKMRNFTILPGKNANIFKLLWF